MVIRVKMSAVGTVKENSVICKDRNGCSVSCARAGATRNMQGQRDG
jgi:hypothetical protein